MKIIAYNLSNLLLKYQISFLVILYHLYEMVVMVVAVVKNSTIQGMDGYR